MRRVVYLSDGAASQYKNYKNIMNLCHHERDFGVPAAWHFFTTAHGKGACDGIGGNVKRHADRLAISKQLDIKSAADFCRHVVMNNIDFILCDPGEIENNRAALATRWEGGRTIPGTLKFHCFKPVDISTINAWVVSCSCATCAMGGSCSESVAGAFTWKFSKPTTVPAAPSSDIKTSRSIIKTARMRKSTKLPQAVTQSAASVFDTTSNPSSSVSSVIGDVGPSTAIATTSSAVRKCDLKVGSTVAALYEEDDDFFVGTVIEPTELTAPSDVRIQFFLWGERRPWLKQSPQPETQQVDVPVSHILMNVLVYSPTGRVRRISDDEYQLADTLFRDTKLAQCQ